MADTRVFVEGKAKHPQVMYHASLPKRLVRNEAEVVQARKEGFTGYPIQAADKAKPLF